MATNTKSTFPTASEKRTRMKLDCDHVTTMSFMKAQPVYVRHMLAGESIDLSVMSNIRPAPMPVPTYGRIRQNVRFFFCPYRLVFPQYDSFMADTIGVNYSNSSLVSSPPVISGDAIYAFLLSPQISTTTNASATHYDFYDGTNYYLFTAYGRVLWKRFYSLGYSFAKDKNLNFNALALLTWAKIMIDWYENQRYLDSASVISVKQLLSFNNPNSYLQISATDLLTILTLGVVTYDGNGYFEGAWDNPVAPTNNQHSSFSMIDPSLSIGSPSTSIDTFSNGTPFMKQSSSSATNIGSAYLHDACKRLTDYQKRHAMSGAYEIDRFLAEHGFVSSYLRELRSIYIGGDSFDIKIGDIYATANGSNGTDSSTVGDYAGRGFGAGNKQISYKTDEDGILVAIASILPSAGYFQGYDRNNRHITKDEFFNADYDALSCQAIEKGEIYVSPNFNFASSNDYTSPFGFTGRYGEMKRAIDRVSGDISLHSVMSGGDSWHLMRTFDDSYFNNLPANIYQSIAFSAGSDANKFNRIFEYTKADLDHFFCFFHFNVNSIVPCRPLFDAYDFESLGQSITMQTQGGKVN